MRYRQVYFSSKPVALVNQISEASIWSLDELGKLYLQLAIDWKHTALYQQRPRRDQESRE